MNKHIKCDDLKQKIFIEDTDFQGVVYHANYLKFFERARSNFLSKLGVSQKELRNQDKAFVVKSIELDYLNSAGLGTEIIVESYVEKKSKARIVFYQKASCLQRSSIKTNSISLFGSIILSAILLQILKQKVATTEL